MGTKPPTPCLLPTGFSVSPCAANALAKALALAAAPSTRFFPHDRAHARSSASWVLSGQRTHLGPDPPGRALGFPRPQPPRWRRSHRPQGASRAELGAGRWLGRAASGRRLGRCPSAPSPLLSHRKLAARPRGPRKLLHLWAEEP